MKPNPVLRAANSGDPADQEASSLAVRAAVRVAKADRNSAVPAAAAKDVVDLADLVVGIKDSVDRKAEARDKAARKVAVVLVVRVDAKADLLLTLWAQPSTPTTMAP